MGAQTIQPSFMVAFFSFQRMVSPFFIGLVYFLGLFCIVVAIAFTLYKGPHMAMAQRGMDYESGALIAAVYAGIIISGLLTILLWRFFCELLIVLFGIFRQLGEIKIMLQQSAQPAVTAARLQATITPVPYAEPASEPDTEIEVRSEPAIETISKDLTADVTTEHSETIHTDDHNPAEDDPSELIDADNSPAEPPMASEEKPDD